jgi:serine-type D-Ala-D-Ala carboxypeptidase/endopeptidase
MGSSIHRHGLRALWIFAGLTLGSASAVAVPSDADIQKIVNERVEGLGGATGGVGIVVGIVRPEGRTVVAQGRLSAADSRTPDADTAFEIGSLTKVFTALLLADMVERREVQLGDAVAKHLPTARIPERNGRKITFLDLATHTSGLPFMPPPGTGDAAEKPYTDERLYEFIANYELPRDIGIEWEYSNVGYWLLAQALAARAGDDYATLLRERVIAPLKLRSTELEPSPAMKAKLAVGHNAALQPAQSWTTVPLYAAMSPTGGLFSTASDLLQFLSVALGYDRSRLSTAMNAMLTTRRPAPPNQQALGWLASRSNNEQLIFHDGGTLGYASAVAWDPKQRVGVVVLSNQVEGVGDIARHLLRPELPLRKPTATKQTEIMLSSAVLDSYAGRYEASDEGTFVIARKQGFLEIQAPPDWGLPALRLRPATERDFFVVELPLRVTFQIEGEGHVTGILVHPPRGQQTVSGRRL